MKKRRIKRKVKSKLIIIVIILLLGLSVFLVNQKTNFILKIKENMTSKENNSNNNDTKDVKDIKNPTKEVLTEEEVKTKKSINLETPSGAVLIGTIKSDDNGWYFLPREPLNITLTYYIDRPENFTNVTKLRMLDDSDDNFNKSIYNNELVTIHGEILNPRSMGTLYLYPYNIENGATVKSSYADSDITAPQNDFGKMNEDLLPSKMNSIIEQGEYKYNFYMVSKETLYRFDNDFINFYLEFVSAFLNYKTSIPCPKKNYADYLFSILDYEFPVFYADGVYDYTTTYDKTNKTVNWKYTSKSKEEHDKLINNFSKEANKFLEGVNFSQSDNKKAQIIYHNLSKSISYDYEALETFKNAESYYVYTKHTGICHSFAFAYDQLLTQVGIESTLATGQSKIASLGHVWSVIKIDGTYYFADPTYEISYQNGTSYAFYGMSLKRRESTNEYFEDNIKIGMYESKTMRDYGNFTKDLNIE